MSLANSAVQENALKDCSVHVASPELVDRCNEGCRDGRGHLHDQVRSEASSYSSALKRAENRANNEANAVNDVTPSR